ncbi:aminomethyl-transferring glycine dehydrogenase subunit GcvPA [candidate division KSB1 bacterium]
MPYIPHSPDEEREMLKSIGISSLDDLFKEIPESLKLKKELDLTDGLSESEVLADLKKLMFMNKCCDRAVSFLGGGAYDHSIPSIINHLILRSEFYTAYTPYQAEVSQGTLQMIYEYQTMICELTGMDVSNASMYDGASAAAEAGLLMSGFKKRNKILISDLVHPNYSEVIKTYFYGQDIELTKIKNDNGMLDKDDLSRKIDENTAGLIVQNPNFFGIIEDVEEIGNICKEKDIMYTNIVNPISLGILKSPGEAGADIAVGEGQPLGIPVSLGGPYLGFFAVKQQFIKLMPGRIIGQTTDVKENTGYVMVLQTREQHIKREKATSNICTNQGLMALCACIYMSIVGKKGIKLAAELSSQNAHYLAGKISNLRGFELKYDTPFFNEFVVAADKDTDEILNKLNNNGFYAGINLKKFGFENGLLIAVTEKRTKKEMDCFVDELSKL